MTDVDYGPWGEPAFVVIAGPRGCGKSVDATLLYPHGYTCALPGGIQGARYWLGDDVYAAARSRVLPVQRLEDVIGWCQAIQEGKTPWLPVLRVDDLSVLAETTLNALKAHYPEHGRGPFQMWGHFSQIVDALKRYAKALDMVIVAGTHLQQPNGSGRKGGPLIGEGTKGRTILLSVADAVYRVEHDMHAPLHPAVYRNDGFSPLWEGKDRLNAVIGIAPMNLREVLHSVGFRFARYPGMEWLDDWADAVAERRTAGTPLDVIVRETVTTLTSQGVAEGTAFWAVRDGVARADLVRAHTPMEAALAALAPVATPGAPPLPPKGESP